MDSTIYSEVSVLIDVLLGDVLCDYVVCHLVLRYMSLHGGHVMLFADVPDQIPYWRRHLTRQCRPTVLCDPYQMQADFEYSVRATPVFRHPRSLSAAHALEAFA
jgi:hypothetical protein